MPTSPFYPKQFLVHPQTFGSAAAAVKTDYERPGQPHRDKAAAAYLQSVIAYTVNQKIYADGSLNRRLAARSAGLDERRFSRLLAGDAWMQLADITALERALGVDLLQVWLGPSFDQEGRWVSR